MGEEMPEMTQFSWEVAQGRLISNALLGFYCCQREKVLGRFIPLPQQGVETKLQM